MFRKDPMQHGMDPSLITAEVRLGNETEMFVLPSGQKKRGSLFQPKVGTDLLSMLDCSR
jgi:hypothetical protein